MSTLFLLIGVSFGALGVWFYGHDQYLRGMHFGVSDPKRACQWLNRHGYNMNYRLKEYGGDL